MTSQFTIVFQLMATVLIGLDVTTFPVAWRPYVAGAIAVAQAIQGTLAHYSTPAGDKINATTGQVTSPNGMVVATVPVTTPKV